MRKILPIVCALFLSVGASAQVVSYGTKDGVYEEIVNCNSNKSLLWSNLKRWVAVSFVSYKHTVDMEDKESGTMVVKFSITDDHAGTFTTSATSAVLQVDVKDNKYKVKVSDPIFEVKPNSECSGDISWMPSSVLESAKIEMQAALNLSQHGIGSYDELKKAIDTYTALRDGTPKYRKPKDEKKGKISSTFQTYDKTVSLGSWIKTEYSYNTDKIVKSLKSGMAYSNDF